MRGQFLLTAICALGLMGCAAVFRDSSVNVHVVSDPPGASARVTATGAPSPTPLDVPVKRGGLTEVRVEQPGYYEHHGTVRKHVNALWFLADLSTCIVPVLLCIPLLVDGASGAWLDVEPLYQARLVPFGIAPGRSGPPVASSRPESTPSPAATAATSAAPHGVEISESERKAAARAAFQEGLALESQKKYDDALVRFQDAQRMYDAPTHLLHMAQCLSATQKLVEAQEAYETLTHRELAASAPAPFRDAVEVGRRELADLQPRIPTLRIQVLPAPSGLRNLVLLVNTRPMPNEVIGIARPINPGTYRITATAWGIPASKPVDITLKEGEQRSVDVRLGRSN